MWVRVSGPAVIVGGGSECTALSSPSIPRLRCPWARHRIPKWLPTAPGVCVCVHAVCVHLGWVKCRALIPSMGYHTWPHVTSKLHDHMYYYIQKWRNVLYRCRFIFNLSWVTLEAAWTIWHSPKTTTWNGGDFLKLYFTLSSSSLK